jgi:hypothetical protein
MRTLTITLAANEGKRFETAGSYFEILTCANDLARIDWEGADGQLVDPWENVKEGVYAAFRFRSFVIKNGATPQTIKLFVGTGNGGNRAAPLTGTVAIAGPASVRSLTDVQGIAGKAYRFSERRSVQVGQNVVAGIYNPTGSGVIAVITGIVGDWHGAAGDAVFELDKGFAYTAEPSGATVKNVGAVSTGAQANSKCKGFGASNQTTLFGFTGGVEQEIEKGRLMRGAVEVQAGGIALAPGECIAGSVVNLAAATKDGALSFAWVEVPI